MRKHTVSMWIYRTANLGFLVRRFGLALSTPSDLRPAKPVLSRMCIPSLRGDEPLCEYITLHIYTNHVLMRQPVANQTTARNHRHGVGTYLGMIMFESEKMDRTGPPLSTAPLDIAYVSLLEISHLGCIFLRNNCSQFLHHGHLRKIHQNPSTPMNCMLLLGS